MSPTGARLYGVSMESGWRRIWQKRDAWLDPAGAVTLFAITSVELLSSGVAPVELTWAMLGGAAGTLPLAWRRRLPLATHAAVVFGNALAVVSVGHANLLGLLVAWVFSGYSVAAHSKGWAAIAGLVLQAIPVVGFAEVQPVGSDSVGPAQLLLMLVPWLAGREVREQRVQAAGLEEQNRRLESEAKANMALAAAEERARIARDVHDVVAHSVSVMVVQAEAADAMLPGNPAGAKQSLESIQTVGRDALRELRQALAMVSSPEADTFHTGPGLDRIPDLIDQMTQLGLEVDLILEGEKAGVPPSVDTAAYRIVREALTNTLKHAGPVAATVRLRVDAKALHLEVSDTGSGSHPSPPGSGHGLIGIRQRVAMYGGEVSVGHTDDGGFLLKVTLPLDGET